MEECDVAEQRPIYLASAICHRFADRRVRRHFRNVSDRPIRHGARSPQSAKANHGPQPRSGEVAPSLTGAATAQKTAMTTRLQFTELQRLGLTEADLGALQGQGYLELDRRPNGRPRGCRLRFRRDNRLRSVYVGNDLHLVARIRKELANLQAKTVSRRQLKRTVRNARHTLRCIKQSYEPTLRELGFHFHGRALRKFRH